MSDPFELSKSTGFYLSTGKGAQLSDLMTARQFCYIKYRDRLKDGKPTQAQVNTVTKMCKDGKFKRAFKIGRSWYIDLDAEGV